MVGCQQLVVRQVHIQPRKLRVRHIHYLVYSRLVRFLVSQPAQGVQHVSCCLQLVSEVHITCLRVVRTFVAVVARVSPTYYQVVGITVLQYRRTRQNLILESVGNVWQIDITYIQHIEVVPPAAVRFVPRVVQSGIKNVPRIFVRTVLIRIHQVRPPVCRKTQRRLASRLYCTTAVHTPLVLRTRTDLQLLRSAEDIPVRIRHLTFYTPRVTRIGAFHFGTHRVDLVPRQIDMTLQTIRRH